MSDVFISYKREDELRVFRLVQALQKQGLPLWWDRGLPGGEQWRVNIEAALTQAQCAVVIWTRASVGPEGAFVKDEAGRAARRNILVPVLLDKVDPPLGFGELQAVDLTRWRGSTRDPFFQDLVAAIRAKMEGRAVPAPQEPMKRLQRRLAAGGLVTALTVVGAAFANNSLNLQNSACGVAGAQSWISDTCGWLGLGARPTREERMAWERLPPGDCTALRQHAKQFPKGAYASTATAMYNAPTVTGSESWIAATFPLRLLVSRDVDASPTEVAASEAAIDRGRKKAEMMCRDGADTKLVRFRSAEVDAQEWLCDEVRGGHVCGFEGRALCAVDEVHRTEQETCHASAAR